MVTFKDLSNRSTADETGSSDPVSLFYGLERPSDSLIKDLFPIQKEALVEWLKSVEEGKNSNLISMDTGTGKTLVGLLAAESMRRKTKGKVLYVCPNNNLIEQTALKAKEYGIPVSTYYSQNWTGEEQFLAHKQICIVNYHSLYHATSTFRGSEIKGVVFDDAHLSIEIIDQQYTVSINLSENSAEYNHIIKLLEGSEIRDTIKSTTVGGAGVSHLVPVHIWKDLCGDIKVKLQNSGFADGSYQWGYVEKYFDKALCFVNDSKVDISLLYPATENHFLFGEKVQKVFLSATIPNRGDLVRVFGEKINRITLDAKDYRPERLFVFSKLIKPSEGTVGFSRSDIANIVDKTLVLTPSARVQKLYSGVSGAKIVTTSEQINDALTEFKAGTKGVLILANRYDGIDLPDSICRSSVIDGLPFVGSLKYRFFSEYFHNHNQSFLRSLIASKLIQAFGRTVRGHNDYSVIFILDLALNRWLLDKDNQKFLRDDVVDDLELGIQFSTEIPDTNSLKDLVNQMVLQDPSWKSYVKENRQVKEVLNTIDTDREMKDIELAEIERQITQSYHNGQNIKTIQLIEEHQEKINAYSQPILGLYLSIASLCAEAEKDYDKANYYSSRAFGIRSLFGKPTVYDGVKLDNQTQRILNSDDLPASFIWETQDNPPFGQTIEEDFKKLGLYLGFDSTRPEKEKDGTLDVLWVNHEERFALGFELKCDKENQTLHKSDIGQCHDHAQWLDDKYPDYENVIYAVGDIAAFNVTASPGSLRYFDLNLVRTITANLRSAQSIKKSNPSGLHLFLKENSLLFRDLFPSSLISDLPSKRMS